MGWTSREEITKTYLDHIDSLRWWGGEFDEDGLWSSYAQELADWDESH